MVEMSQEWRGSPDPLHPQAVWNVDLVLGCPELEGGHVWYQAQLAQSHQNILPSSYVLPISEPIQAK